MKKVMWSLVSIIMTILTVIVSVLIVKGGTK